MPLPFQQAHEIQQAVLGYLRATFAFQDAPVKRAFDAFLAGESGTPLFKGPYVSLKLPFVQAGKEEIPLEIQPDFPPFAHQMAAFHRLTTQDGHQPEPTLLTTGTGSGKTEAFLYPLLDYCYQQRHRPGIKAILLYPMNALATDQASRIAQAIAREPLLRKPNGEPWITAGLFIGTGKKRDNGQPLPTLMGSDHLIEDRESILRASPDLLLTNFKMLDFALLQGQYDDLWRHNYRDPELLRFLVLDELHTYDGAQGTDVANLLRRLRLKLKLPVRQLCPVGTSATIGSGPQAGEKLARYAQRIFGEPISSDAIIEEKRLTVDEFFPQEDLEDMFPSVQAIRRSLQVLQERPQDYQQSLSQLWRRTASEGIALGVDLRRLRILQELVDICSVQPESLTFIRAELARRFSPFAQLEETSLQDGVIGSLLVLLARAKVGDASKPFPFLYVQVQLWLRAMSRIQRLVQEGPAFSWEEEADHLPVKSLPPWHCRECGASGWVALKPENKDRLNPDHTAVYRASIQRDKNLWYLNTWSDDHRCSEEYEATQVQSWWVEPGSLRVFDVSQPETVKLWAFQKNEGKYSQNVCPQCSSRGSISFMGAGVASLASVALSQVLASEMDESPLGQRKVLTFTNGVQDAAHRAGFFQARNYRFLFRTALQQVVSQLPEPNRLSELYVAFVEYWKSAAVSEEHYVYQFFPADHQATVQPREYWTETDGFDRGFLGELDRRISWEIWSQYTYNALIGRTLEKSGASATYFQPEQLREVYARMRPWLVANSLEQLGEQEFLAFLSGWLHRLRTRGGVDHPYLGTFRTDYPSYYSITQNRNRPYFLMRNFGKRTRLPYFLRLDPAKGVMDQIILTKSANRNWFHRYFSKAFTLGRSDFMLINDFYRALLPIMEAVGLVDRKQINGKANYGLAPEAIWVSSRVERYCCATCGSQIHTTQEAGKWLEGAACLRFHCSGRYELASLFGEESERFYQQVYARGHVVRVFSAEHTGMLDREKREGIEQSFKSTTDPRGLNALVATSTLEMGIDIGDLNHAFNTGIPPTPANFLQRIGRAGRKSGQALLLNMSGRSQHDLYFFTSPEEMMAGEVGSPGCFLEAIDMLRRHLFAFFVDSWSKQQPLEHKISPTIRRLLRKGADRDPRLFWGKLLHWIDQRGEQLFEDFETTYLASIPDSGPLSQALDRLNQEVRHGQFLEWLERFIPDLRQEFEYHWVHRKLLQQRIDELPQTDPGRELLNKDLSNLDQAIRSFRKRPTLEQLTNSGYLPNYGFPETGVELEARIRRPNARDERNRALYLEFNPILRPARQAIREFAPGNVFYGQGFHFPIKGIRVGDWQEEVQHWRFCGRCDHLSLDHGQPRQACPKCGDTSWYNQTNTHDLLSFKKAITFEEAELAGLDDRSEEREEGYYVMTHHFELPDSGQHGAYVLSRIPFGIEFISQVRYTEINTGEQGVLAFTPHKVQMQGKEISHRGFIVCRHCGRAHTHTHNRAGKAWEAREYHFSYCKHSRRAYEGEDNEVFAEVFLRRTLQTEVLRILLPVQEINSDLRLALFKAGLTLGIQHYFGGNPQHLELKTYQEIHPQTGRTQHFLMLMDTIPGGTGYLAQIASTEVFTQVLKFAYESIANCQCGEADGCYHCVYSYANQYERELLSRSEAEKLFAEILSKTDEWQFRTEGLRGIEGGYIEESELERLFVQLLQRYCLTEASAKQGWEFSPRKEGGSVRYTLEVPQAEGSPVAYELIPQQEVGVKYTRPDFVLRPRHVPEGREAPPELTIYLDGYQFHASQDNDRFPADMQKRWRLREKGIPSWILTWEDLQHFEQQIMILEGKEGSSSGKNQHDSLSEWNRPGQWQHLKGKHPLFPVGATTPWGGLNSLARLLEWMQAPHQVAVLSRRWLLGCKQGHWDQFLEQTSLPIWLTQPGKEGYAAQPTTSQDYWAVSLPVEAPLQQRTVIRLDGEVTLTMLELTPQEEGGFPSEAWNMFWRLYNLLQWGQLAIRFGELLLADEQLQTALPKESELLEEFEERYHPLIRELRKRNIPFFEEQGFELTNHLEETIGEAAIQLPLQQVVIDVLDESSQKAFEKAGYRIFPLESFSFDALS